MKQQSKEYTAYIAGNKFSQPFDSAKGATTESAAAAVKRKNSPDWKDCCIWVVGPCGYWVTVYDNGI